jgi:hypothetical protein
MTKGERQMAVVNYKIKVAAGVATITPDPNQVGLRTGDFMTFTVDPAGTDVFVKVGAE